MLGIQYSLCVLHSRLSIFLLCARCTKYIFHFSVCSKSPQKVLLFFYLSPLSFPYHDDTEDTSEHQCACSCLLHPYLSLFNVTWTQRTWTSTLVLTHVLYISYLCSCPFNTMRAHRTQLSTLMLAHVLYVLITVPLTPWEHPGHE